MKQPSSVVLVTGASGALGWVLASRLVSSTDVLAAYHTHPLHPKGTRGVTLDLEDPVEINSLLDKHRPRTIFHLAAITHPDLCEDDPDLARKVNLDSTREIARWAGAAGAKMVFISTDLVFDGRKGDYREDDSPAPLSVYGRTKLEAEECVGELCPGALVVRPSLFYGVGGPSSRTFLSDLLETLSGGRRMRLFTDQLRNPVLLDDLATALISAVERGLAGLFHVAGGEVLSRYEFGEIVCDVFGFNKDLLVPVRMADFEYKAARPLDSSLNIGRIKGATGFEPTPIVRALSEIKAGR